MSNRKVYLVRFLAALILGVSYFMGSSLAAPAIQRRDDGDGLTPPTLVDAVDSLQKTVNDNAATLRTTPVIMPTLPDNGTTKVAKTPTPTTPQVELVPAVTVVKQLGTTAVVVASQGKTSTIPISAPGVPTPTNILNQKPSSAGVVLTISSSMIAASLAIAMWVVF